MQWGITFGALKLSLKQIKIWKREYLVCLKWFVFHLKVPHLDSEVVPCHQVAPVVAELYIRDGWDDFREKWAGWRILRLLKVCKRKNIKNTLFSRNTTLFTHRRRMLLDRAVFNHCCKEEGKTTQGRFCLGGRLSLVNNKRHNNGWMLGKCCGSCISLQDYFSVCSGR